SKTTRSSAFSPMPQYRIGRVSSFAIATAMPPFAVPSSFVKTRPVTFAAFMNSRAWLNPFCPVTPSTTRSVSFGAPRISRPAPRDSLHLFKLRHQIRFVMKASRGVNDQHIGVASFRRLQRIEKNGGGISSLLLLDQGHARALGPDRQLIGSRGAESVRRADQH